MKKRSRILLIIISLVACGVFFWITVKKNSISNSIISNEKEKESQEAEFRIERDKYEFDMVKDPLTGKIPKGIYAAEMAQAKSIPLKKVDGSQTARITALNSYFPAGPNNIGARTRALAYDLRYNGTTNRVIIAGCVSGGIMRTTDGGLNWIRVSPDNEIHNVTVVTQDPRPGFQDTWYAGGGESIGNTADEIGALYLGHGLYKSTDNGASWVRLPLTSITDIPGNAAIGSSLETFDNPFDFIHKIAINPANGDLYVCGHRRLLRSKDGGNTFQTVFGSTVPANSFNGQSEVVITNTGKLVLAVNGGTPDVNLKGVWISTTGDLGSWTRIAGGTVLNVDSVANWRGNTYAANDAKRIILALAPSNQNL
ncbi:MAG: hypothetical protein M3O67_02835, partial [Bacteroidota bacterium]|nr:hypothetical protein [Bacteroidota bacterium]